MIITLVNSQTCGASKSVAHKGFHLATSDINFLDIFASHGVLKGFDERHQKDQLRLSEFSLFLAPTEKTCVLNPICLISVDLNPYNNPV